MAKIELKLEEGEEYIICSFGVEKEVVNKKVKSILTKEEQIAFLSMQKVEDIKYIDFDSIQDKAVEEDLYPTLTFNGKELLTLPPILFSPKIEHHIQGLLFDYTPFNSIGFLIGDSYRGIGLSPIEIKKDAIIQSNTDVLILQGYRIKNNKVMPFIVYDGIKSIS